MLAGGWDRAHRVLFFLERYWRDERPDWSSWGSDFAPAVSGHELRVIYEPLDGVQAGVGDTGVLQTLYGFFPGQAAKGFVYFLAECGAVCDPPGVIFKAVVFGEAGVT